MMAYARKNILAKARTKTDKDHQTLKCFPLLPCISHFVKKSMKKLLIQNFSQATYIQFLQKLRSLYKFFGIV